MATPFRQPIWPGDEGKDIRAVKHGLKRMRAQDAGQLNDNVVAGSMFVHVIRALERNNGLHMDGIYGPKVHALVAKHFTAADVTLYKAAAIRKHALPGTDTTAAAAAKQLLAYYKAGKYHADNPGDLPQIQAAADGKAVWSPMGKYVYIDKRVFEVLNWLIGKGHKIGTYALCADHHYDGPHGHSGGLSVDISSIDGVGISSASASSKTKTRAVANLLHGVQGELHPWQLICDGYGYQHDGEISSCMIPSAGFYDYSTRAAHRNHIHVGYYR